MDAKISLDAVSRAMQTLNERIAAVEARQNELSLASHDTETPFTTLATQVATLSSRVDDVVTLFNAEIARIDAISSTFPPDLTTPLNNVIEDITEVRDLVSILAGRIDAYRSEDRLATTRALVASILANP